MKCPQANTEDDHPTLHKEVKAAVHSLKHGKLTEVDSKAAEMVRARGEAVTTALTTIW